MNRKPFHRELEQRLGHAEIIPKLPCVLGEAEASPAGLVGATITAIGSIAGEQSGLVIEYREKGTRIRRRVVLGFSDCWMAPIACVSMGDHI
jgi:hypothetical protein